MSDSQPASANRAVFLSYASQDAEAARRICESLRVGGVEVWFDADGGLEHGDEWDAKIRRQIKECVLFIPVISANTQAREEGYFRLEWDLAAERARTIASGVPFILPVVIDDTKEPAALVPDRFRALQWTRLRDGDVPADVQQRFLKLWSHRTGLVKSQAGSGAGAAPATPLAAAARENKSSLLLVPLALAAAALVGGGAWWFLRQPSPPRAAPAPVAVVAPAKSAPPAAPRSEARQLADRAFALSVDKYDSTLDDYTLAETLMQKALTLDASDGEILARSAQLHLMFRNRGFDLGLERIAKGREQAERAIRLVPDSAEAVFALGLAQRYTGNRDASIASYERVITLDPNHARALLFLGSLRIGVGKTDEGLAFYARARLQPDWAPLADYYEFLRQFGDRNFTEADRLARNSYRAGPSANSASGIALVHLSGDGDLDAAARELAAIPSKLLNVPRIVYVTAFVQLSRRKPEEALKALVRLPDEFVQDSWFTGPKASLVGRAHALAGRDTAARLAWEAGLAVTEGRLKSAPGDAAFHHCRGMLLAWLGRAEDALQEARTVRELFRGAAPAWNLSEATIYAALGRADLALPLLEQMLNDDGDNGRWPISITLLRQDPLWDKLRDEPGFQKLFQEPTPVAKPRLSAAPTAKTDDKSVAVLAFKNVGSDPANDALVDGIGLELISVLGRVQGLTVRGGSSLEFSKTTKATAQEKGRQLAATYLVDGSVQRGGDTVRITASVTRAATNEIVWTSAPLNRDVKNFFAVQEEIAGLIAKALSLKLTAGSAASTAAVKPEAMELYLRGRQSWALRTRENMGKAEELFQRAIALQPDFARAHAGLADVWLTLADLDGLARFKNRNSHQWDRIVAKLDEAAALDPNSADCFATRGQMANLRWQFAEADQFFRRALELNPNHPSAHQWYARHLSQLGRMDEALVKIDAALAADPFAPRIASNGAMIYVLAGRPTRALELAERSLALQSGNPQAIVWKAEALVALGRSDDLEQFIRTWSGAAGAPVGPIGVTFLAQVGRLDRPPADAPSLGFETGGYVDTTIYNLIRSNLIFGKKANALARLVPEDASYANCEWMAYLPLFDQIRGEPAFRRFYDEVGLGEAHARAQAWRKAHPPEKPASK